jgi:flagellar operon protein
MSSGAIPNPALLPPGALGGTPSPASTSGAATAVPGSGPSFADVLADRASATASPTFSKHALDRLAQRGIDVSATTLGRLTDGIQRAAAKGSRSSVVLVDGTAFVTAVQSRTVITAVTQDQMRSHVFTNIDSAVIA